MEDFFTQRNVMHRYFLDSSDDTGTIQTRNVTGLDDNDKPTKVIVIAPHGFSSNPVKDAHMVGMTIGHMRDLLVLMGGEHPDHRPTNLGSGDAAFYNLAKKVLLQTKQDDLDLGLPGKFSIHTLKEFSLDFGGGTTLDATQSGFTFTVGGVSWKLTSSGWAQTGGSVQHDTHDIGATHLHTDTQPGNGLTGKPQ